MKFYIKPKHFAQFRSFKIRDESQGELFQIKGKFLLGLRDLSMSDMNNQVLYTAKRRFTWKFSRLYEVYDEGGKTIAYITRTLGWFRPRYQLIVEEIPITFSGTVHQHLFSLNLNNAMIASLSRGEFSFGEAYEIDVITEIKPLLYLFLVILIDQINHELKKFHG